MSHHVSLGRFVWYDQMSAEPKAAIAFYTKVFGWSTEEWKGSDEPYTMFTANGLAQGGFMNLPPGAPGIPPHWMGYVSTPDADATVARATAMGGKVLMPAMDIPEVGRFAVLADPQGAAFAVFTPGMEMAGIDDPAKVGEFSWHELATTDPDAAFGFYGELFGWKKIQDLDMGPAGTYRIFGVGDLPWGGVFKKPAAMPGPSAWLYYVRVADVKATIATAEKLGGKCVNGPMEVPGGDQIAQLVDPQGGMFAVHQTPAK